MGDLEMICCSIVISGVVFLADNLHNRPKDFSKIQPPYAHYVSDEDKALLCSIWKDCSVLQEAIVYESRGEPLAGKRMVAKVVLNRVQHPHWPDTVEEVLYEPKQFSYVNDKHLQRKPDKNDWVVAGKVAYNLLTERTRVDSEATFYHNKRVRPSWSKHKEVVAEIGNHVFYKGGK